MHELCIPHPNVPPSSSSGQKGEANSILSSNCPRTAVIHQMGTGTGRMTPLAIEKGRSMDEVVLNISDDLLARLGSARSVLTVTDAGRDPALEYTRRLAAQLAARLKVGLFLADRSQETWGDTEHVGGPADLDWLRSHGIAHMVEQIEEAHNAGVIEVHGVASSMPSLESFDAVLTTTGADVIVAPDHYEKPKLWQRLSGGKDPVPALKDRIGEKPVTLLVAHPDGTVTSG